MLLAFVSLMFFVFGSEARIDLGKSAIDKEVVEKVGYLFVPIDKHTSLYLSFDCKLSFHVHIFLSLYVFTCADPCDIM